MIEEVLRLVPEGFEESAQQAQKVEGSLNRAADAAARASSQANQLGASLSKAASAFNLASGITGGSPLLQGVGRVLSGGATGSFFGGPVGAAAGAALALGTTIFSVQNQVNVPVQDGDLRRAAAEASEATYQGLRRRFDDIQEQLQAAMAQGAAGLTR